MQSAEIARRYLAHFEARGHAIVPSASLVADDPTLLFVVAGMQPFKPYLLGQQTPPWKRVADVQKVRPHPGHRRGRQDHQARDVLPDARQLVVRRLLQGRRDPLGVGAADQVRVGRRLRLPRGQAVGHRAARRRRVLRDLAGPGRRARVAASSAAA